MTQPQDDDVKLSETAPEEGETRTDSQTSGEPGEDAGEGQHGRPSDDSDPGHS